MILAPRLHLHGLHILASSNRKNILFSFSRSQYAQFAASDRIRIDLVFMHDEIGLLKGVPEANFARCPRTTA